MKLNILLVFIAIILIGCSKQVEINKTKPIASVWYSCNQTKTIHADFYKGESKPATAQNMPPTPGGFVNINLSDGRTMKLAQTISADGGRYTNQDESFIFWDKGNNALVFENNEVKDYANCTLRN